MAYVKQKWRNATAAEPTPLIASRFNHMENGIEAAHILYESVKHGFRIVGYTEDFGGLPVEGAFLVGDGYIVGTKFYIWDGSQWRDNGYIRGPQGPKGDAGDVGPGLVIQGVLEEVEELPGSASVGDAYVIESELYVWRGDIWVNTGSMEGPPGETGPPGPQGLVGPTGPVGDTGPVGGSGPTGPQGLQGPKGDTGSTGPQGAKGNPGLAWKGNWHSGTQYATDDVVGYQGSSYVATSVPGIGVSPPSSPWSLVVAKGDTGEAGPTGPEGGTGPTGPQGEKGTDGTGVNIIGERADEQSLPGSGSPGDAYLVQGDLYVWDDDASDWVNVGTIQGPQGPTGPTGPTGEEGVTGPTGPQGDTGPGLPIGGSIGQIAVKQSATDYDVDWETPQPPTGSVTMFAGEALPDGWLWCDGSNVSRSTYAGLFSVIGTAYGSGDGETTFAVPNLMDRMPLGASSNNELATTGGEAEVTLSVNQLPAHSHESGTLDADSAGAHTHDEGTLTTNSTGAHVHSGPSHTHSSGTLSTGSAGSHTHTYRTRGPHDSVTHGHPTASRVTRGSGAGSDNQDITNDSGAINSGGSHTHSISGSTASGGTGNTGSSGSHSHAVSGSTASGGSHSHNISGSTADTGSGEAHNNMPPYLALNFIIKT